MRLKKTSLHAAHRRLGAKMVEFAGWEMPVQYSGALREHLAARKGVTLFDVSHMGRFEIRGKDALSNTNRITCNDVSRLEDGQAQYSALLYPQGTFVDDIVVYRLSSERFLLCVNAGNRKADQQWICRHLEGQVEFTDRSEKWAQLAVQGPKSEKILQPLCDTDLSRLGRYRSQFVQVLGSESLISRTGYTGEDGFELYLTPEAAGRIWNRLLQSDQETEVLPAGLASRNTLRLEMAYALYGHDIDSTTTPLEAGLAWLVKLDQEDFVGREALIAQKSSGVERRLSGFELIERGIARDQYPVFVEGTRVAQVTSGSFAPSLNKAIGLVYLPLQYSRPGQELEVEVRGKRLRGRVVPIPFYPSGATS